MAKYYHSIETILQHTFPYDILRNPLQVNKYIFIQSFYHACIAFQNMNIAQFI